MSAGLESFAPLPEDESYELPVPGTARGIRTRARLLAAAEDVFGEHGYERASVTAITQAADVAQGTFYVYFPSKHAIFVELVKDFAVRVRHALAASAAERDGEASRADVEIAGLEVLFRFALEHPGLYRVVREAQFVAPQTYRWYYESFVTAYIENFERVSPGFGASLDTESLGYAMAGVADMLGLRWVVWEGRLPPRRAMEDLTRFFNGGFEALRTPRRRRRRSSRGNQ